MPTYQDMEGNWIRTDVTIQEMREEIDRLTAENAALRERVEEREADMHVRIRQGYDSTVADCWKARVAVLERELAEMQQSNDALREIANTLKDDNAKQYEELAEARERVRESEKTAIDGLDRICVALVLEGEMVVLSEVLDAITGLRAKFAKAVELLRRAERNSEVRETENFTSYFVSHIDDPTMAGIRTLLAEIDGKDGE